MSLSVYVLAKRLYDKGIFKADKIEKLYEIGELTEGEYNKIIGGGRDE